MARITKRTPRCALCTELIDADDPRVHADELPFLNASSHRRDAYHKHCYDEVQAAVQALARARADRK